MAALFNPYFTKRLEFYKPREAIESARARRPAIEKRLDNDHIVSMFESGSLNHGTAIWYYSDVDYFVRFYDSRPSSDAALQRVKNSMVALYPTTDIRISKPAVKLNFDSGVKVELVPAYPAPEDDTYWIPNPNGDWMKSSPTRQNRFVTNANNGHGEVKDTVRLLKIWKGNRSVPVSSFYLEMAVARYASSTADFSKAIAMYAVLLDIESNRVPSFEDPSTFLSQIEGCTSQSARTETSSKAKSAHENIHQAVDAAVASEDQSAGAEYLERVFGEA